MSISRAMEELVEKVREIGVGDFFDGMDYDEIIEQGLYYYGKHIEAELEGIKEDMDMRIDSESDEPIQTEAYQDIDPISTYGGFPHPHKEEDECCECGSTDHTCQDCPVFDLIEGTDYLSEWEV